MSSIRELATEHPHVWLTLGGLMVGCVFGATALRTNFCVMGALSDVVNLSDDRRLRSWLLAMAVAMLGAQVLAATGITPLAASIYLTPSLNWLGNLLGGLMFGYGMVFAGGCASRNIVRAGAGDLRALVLLLVIGISAYATIGGILGPLRAWLEAATAIDLASQSLTSQSLAEMLGALLPATGGRHDLLIGTLGAAALVAYCLSSRDFRVSAPHVTGGLVTGLTVVAGWAITGLAIDDLAVRPVTPASLSFVRPAGDTLEWLQRFTALGWPGFGVSSLLGALLGSFAAASAAGRFRIQAFSDTGDMLRGLSGAVLMGIGGVLALGCTIGQTITGLSTLAAGSLIATAAIAAGGVLGLKALARRVASEP